MCNFLIFGRSVIISLKDVKLHCHVSYQSTCHCIIAGFDCRVGKQFLAALESLPANRTRPRMNDPLKCKTFVRSVVHQNYLVIRQCRGSTDFLSLIMSAVKLLVYVVCMSFHMRPRYFFVLFLINDFFIYPLSQF